MTFVVLQGNLTYDLTPPLIDDNLDDGSGPFVAESDPDITLEYVDGGYRMALTGADVQIARHFWAVTEREVVVAADVIVRGDPVGDYAVGVACVGPGAQYIFAVANTGATALFLEDYETPRSELLDTGNRTTSSPAEGLRLQLECRGGGNAPTELAGSVDGRLVLQFSDPDGYESFRGMGLWVGSAIAVDVLWDNPYASDL